MKSKTINDSILKPYAWIILLIVFLISVAAPLNQFKVPPVMPSLIKDFQLNMTNAGLLMSIFSFAGLFLAFPAGMILSKHGQKKTVMTALFSLILGALIGAFSQTDFMLLIGRFFEGAGMVIIGVSAPVIISSWFPKERRGLALGIWSAWVSTGVILMMNLSPIFTPEGQWKQTWWIGTIYTVAVLVMFLILFRKAANSSDSIESKESNIRESFIQIIKLKDVWLLSIALFAFNIMVLVMNTFFPTYFMKIQNIAPQEADFYSSIANLVMLFSCPFGGWLADKTGSRKVIMSVCLGLLAVWWILIFRVPSNVIPVFMGVFGLLSGPVVTLIITALPDAVKTPALIGFGMSLLMFWHHFGEFVGPLYFGKILDLTSSWSVAGFMMLPICAIGAITAIMMKIK